MLLPRAAAVLDDNLMLVAEAHSIGANRAVFFDAVLPIVDGAPACPFVDPLIFPKA